MNAALLLDHYPRIADAPDAIARLRSFVLDLAVRGKLVEQDAGNEPASELLKRIAAEKARLAKAGKNRKPKAVPGLANFPYSLPDSWAWSQIAEIGIINPRVDADDDMLASFVPMTLIAAEYGIPNGHEPRSWIQIKKGYTHFAEGDVGLAKITPCFENGKSTVFQNLTGGMGSGTTELHVVRPLFVDPAYVLVFWKCPFFIENGIPRMIGTAGQKRVPTEYFAYSPFPLPPLAEQNRIVAKVDELMALCDQLEAARAEREAARDKFTLSTLAKLNTPDSETLSDDARFALANLAPLTTRADQIKQLRQTILNLAVRGKLVEQDASDEPAKDLVRRIQRQIQDVTQSLGLKAPKLPVISDEQAPFELPAGWCWARFPDLGAFGRGRSKHRPRNDPALYADGEHRMIQTGDVARSKGLIQTQTAKYNHAGLAQSRLWPKGTLCITIAANIADSGTLDFAACFPDSVVGFVPAPCFENARYFEYFMRTAKADLLAFAPATAQKNINLDILMQVMIPLPPLAEQHRIVAKVDELMALCNQLEASLSDGEQARARLLESVLHHALEPA
ncbi:restriction endonuclease subunit S [Sphingomonas sp. 3P27F8]|uniref:restriction endonuclease subunit S n=1 Tax=Sphingomonas sp. 3P27F8 TaxID=2502213 RepID=UPI0010F89141|nr:restriction endonuclease subunit S [Sphingomonas sp. 3P27F8]